jgi:hypothetical protein
MLQYAFKVVCGSHDLIDLFLRQMFGLWIGWRVILSYGPLSEGAGVQILFGSVMRLYRSHCTTNGVCITLVRTHCGYCVGKYMLDEIFRDAKHSFDNSIASDVRIWRLR